MSTLLQEETDYKTRDAVEAELRWTPQIVDAAQIGVAVDGGVVTLSGEVPTYPQKLAAGKAALRTKGVTAIANDIQVVVGDKTYTDAHLAEDARNALRLNGSVPRDRVEVEVRKHIVYLTGTVEWDYQRRAAQRSVEGLFGAQQVINEVKLTPRASSSETHALIRSALVRNANVDANHIVVTINGSTATLTGTVSSSEEKRQAGLAAWRSPHINWVHNELRVVLPKGI